MEETVEVMADRVTMKLPARKEFARLLRLAVAGIASRMNFDVDRIEDLKIALEEAYLIAVQNADKQFEVDFDIFADRLELFVTGLRAFDNQDFETYRKYSLAILHAVVDKVEWEKGRNGANNLRLIKFLE